LNNENNVLLELNEVTVAYGVIPVVRGLNLHVNKGEVVALLGRNGAGKSSTMKAIAGLLPLKSGSIKFDSDVISEESVHKRVGRGIALVPEGRWILSPLTVKENLRLSGRSSKNGEGFTFDNVFDLFPVLKDRQNQQAGSLSGGEQQMLAVARALMTNPSLILMDEPSMGLSPIMTDRVLESLIKVNHLGVAILIVEQDIAVAQAVSDSVYVLHQGEIVLERTASNEISLSEIESAYFD
jgi:branched-chain amino acid transport system ATP-binding protein